MPIEVARAILDCALKGMHKGQGKRRPRLSHGDKLRRQAIIAFARKRKSELQASGMTTIDAEYQAAEEARVLAKDRYSLKLAVQTIRSLISRSDV